MKKLSKFWPKAWQGWAWVVLFILFLWSLAGAVERWREFDESVELIPEDVYFLLEVKKEGVSASWLEALWGEQGGRLAQVGGKVIGLPSGEVVFLYFDINAIKNFETQSYRGYYLENLITSETHWRTFRGDWVFEGNKQALKELIDMWEYKNTSLDDSVIWRELKDNLPRGGARLFVFETGRDLPTVWRGSGVSLVQRNAKTVLTGLTLVDRKKVKDAGFGQSRQKFRGEIFNEVPVGVCYAMGGQDIKEQIGWAAEVLGEAAPKILGWWSGAAMQTEIGTDLILDEKVWTEESEVLLYGLDGKNHVHTESESLTQKSSLVIKHFQRMTSGNARWAALVYPAECAEFDLPILEKLSNLQRVFMEQQVWDDRIITTVSFE